MFGDKVVVEYRGSERQRWKVGPSRGLTKLPEAQRVSGLYQLLVAAFLPVGYPASVTPDYAGFVLWHTVQAISSYVRGILSSHAVFKGLGVGSQAASAFGAVFQFFVRDILGMAGGILFAYAAGGNFDSNAKQWRLFADVMNDVAMALDLASPLIPGAFIVMASLGSVARAMVGMAAGATHAALTQHFAAAGSNPADISAKAESRERACSIVGSLLGMVATQRMADSVLTAWGFFAMLTLVHVWANIKALRCLVLTSLNEPRLALLLQHYQHKEKVLNPKQVSDLEHLLIPPLAAAIRWCSSSSKQTAAVRFGVRLSRVLSSQTSASQPGILLQQTLQQQQSAAERQYMIFVTGSNRKAVEVVIHKNSSHKVQLQAYLHALHLAAAINQVPNGFKATDIIAQQSQQWVDQQLPQFIAALRQGGWELDRQLHLPHPEWTAEWWMDDK